MFFDTQVKIKRHKMLNGLLFGSSPPRKKIHQPVISMILNNYWIGFCDIRNGRGRGERYQQKLKAEADNANRDLDCFGYHKN